MSEDPWAVKSESSELEVAQDENCWGCEDDRSSEENVHDRGLGPGVVEVVVLKQDRVFFSLSSVLF